MNTEELVEWIKELIAEDKMYKFYKSKYFQELRAEVLQKAHYECEICRSKGRITKATTVHHIYYVRNYPQYALSMYVIDKDGNRVQNLIAICNSCHNREHEEKLIKSIERKKKDNIIEERWD